MISNIIVRFVPIQQTSPVAVQKTTAHITLTRLKNKAILSVSMLMMYYGLQKPPHFSVVIAVTVSTISNGVGEQII